MKTTLGILLAFLGLVGYMVVSTEFTEVPGQCMRTADGKVFPATVHLKNGRLDRYRVTVGDMRYSFLPKINREGVWECRKIKTNQPAKAKTSEPEMTL